MSNGTEAISMDGNPDGSQIGAQLRAARQARRLTIDDVAERSGLTKGFISRLERDQANASVASLLKLCTVLGIGVASLFQASNGEVVRSGSYPRISFGGSRMEEYLLTPRNEERVQAIYSMIEPGGGSGNEAYSLPADVEFVFVLEGTLEVTVSGRNTSLAPGDAFTFHPQDPHSFTVDSSQTGHTRVLWFVSPGLTSRQP